jgi:hypothetical protein
MRFPLTAPQARSRCLLLLATALAALAGCASQDRLTADAINCRVADVSVVPSEFKRRGSETAWCATCKGKLYQCATNAARSRTVCREAREGEGCL